MRNRLFTALAATAAAVLLLGACHWPSHTGMFQGAGVQADIIDQTNGDGQYLLDQGFIVNWNRCKPYAAGPNGEYCTVHLAGHNTTHGAIFNLVDDLNSGDQWIYFQCYGDGSLIEHHYVVSYKALVPAVGSGGQIFGPSVLQTSQPNNMVMLVYSWLGWSVYLGTC